MENDKYQIHSYGCKVNTYDTGLLQKRLDNSSWEDKAENPSVHILNTCAVTAEATKDAIRKIRKLKKENPKCKVVVTGCAAQVDTEHFKELKEADLVVANSHKGDLGKIIKDHLSGIESQKVFKSNIFKKQDLEAGGGTEKAHTRTFLKIQDGCNSFCTFCVIPFARGKSRSLTVQELVQRVNDLHNEGVQETVITGIHIGDYKDETLGYNNQLEDLVESLLAKTKMPRFRISSLEPVELSDRLLELYSDERLCPHFHMSIQSVNSKVLKDMKRNYSRKEVEESLKQIAKRVPGAFVGMDVIAGFPGESDEEFQETYEVLSALPWTRMHVFPYSRRSGTFADRMDWHLPLATIKERALKLRKLSSERYATQALEQVGSEKKVLLLKKPGVLQGVSRDYWPVKMNGDLGNYALGNVDLGEVGREAGREVLVRVIGYDHSLSSRMDGCLEAEIIPPAL